MNITQEDREAAAEVGRASIGLPNRWAQLIREGTLVDHALVQAFARHRQSAMLRCAEIAEAEQGRAEASVFFEDHSASCAEQIAAAIRKAAQGEG